MLRGWWVFVIAGLLPAAGLAPLRASEEAPDRASIIPEGASFRLAYKFRPREVVRYELSHDMSISTQYADVSDVARNKSEARRCYRVVAVNPDGSGDLELMIEWVHMKASNTQNEEGVVFKSDDPRLHHPKFEHILKTIGKPQAVIRFSPAGMPLKVTPANPITANKPEKLTSEDDSAGESPETYLLQLPEGPVPVGATWKEKFELPVKASGKLTVKVALLRQYRLAAVEGTLATIEFRTSILTPVEDPEIAAQLIQRETVGRVVFDIERGVIVSRRSAVSRTVVNPFGPKSSIQAVSNYEERLLPDATASAPTPDVK